MVPRPLPGRLPAFVRLASRRIAGTIRRFGDETGGAILVVFSLLAPVLLMFAGAAIDLSRTYSTAQRAKMALDSAVLAGARSLIVKDLAHPEEMTEKVRAYVFAQLPRETFEGGNVTVTVNETSVTATAVALQRTPFLAIASIPDFKMPLRSVAALAKIDLEIALVVDTTGSMRVNGHVPGVTAALNDLVTDLARIEPKFSLVPFAETVNLGSNREDSWIDIAGLAPTHGLMFDESARRVVHHDLFRQMGVQWSGCVEMRGLPYDVLDTPPSADARTKWVPYFGPAINPFANYLASGYRNVSGIAVVRDPARYSPGNLARVADPGHPGENYDPQSNCPRNPIIPLTSNAGTIRDGINSLDFDGGTVIPAGLYWGWATLSPGEPFTEGVPYGKRNSRKIMILMSDGKNDMMVEYNAYGIFYDKRLGQNGASWNNLSSAIDARMEALCTNIKNEGITLYVVSYALGDDRATQAHKAKMDACATRSDYHFDAKNPDALRDSLRKIVENETPLRLTE